MVYFQGSIKIKVLKSMNLCNLCDYNDVHILVRGDITIVRCNTATGGTLRITKKNLQDEEFPHELFPATRQKTKIRNAFTNNIKQI